MDKDNFFSNLYNLLFGKFEKPEEIKYPQVNIVSLGCNCMPRTILTRYGIKPRKIQGELSCPFDLVIHHTERVTHYLKNDFEGYFDDLECKAYKKNFLDFRGRAVWSKTDGTMFNHDKDCGVNDQEKLINRISSRIENLRAILKDEKPILFVQSLVTNQDVKNLYEVLKEIRKDKKFELLIFDLKHNINEEIEGVHILDIPYPYEGYRRVWNKKKYYTSKEGISFEKAMADKAIEIIETKLI